jgi:hypothetical protein
MRNFFIVEFRGEFGIQTRPSSFPPPSQLLNPCPIHAAAAPECATVCRRRLRHKGHMEALHGTTAEATAHASSGGAALPALARQRHGCPPVRTAMPCPVVVGCPGEGTGGDVEASHGWDLAARKGRPAPPKPKGTATTASGTPTAASTAPATPTTTTFDAGLNVSIDGAQEVFDGMPMR